MTGEMHPTRWGDPDRARPLPPETRAMVEAVFGTTDRPAADTAPSPVPASALERAVLGELAALVGPAHVRTDDQTRRLRTRGKSTPDLIRARAGDLADAPDAVVRPA